MADNVTLNAMTGGATVGADEVTDGTLGTVKVQYVKLMDGTLDGTTKGVIDATYGLKVDVARSVNVVLGTGSNTIGSIASIGTSVVPGTAATNLGKAEDAAHASGDTGVFVLGVRNNNAATTFTNADGDYSPVAVDASGSVFIKSPYRPTPYKLISAATTNATSVSATANTLLFGYYISNTNTSVRYVKFYNKASAPTVGTDTPVLVLAIPGSGAANVAFDVGINFSTGLAFATTTGAADSDTTAVAANEVIVNLVYATY